MIDAQQIKMLKQKKFDEFLIEAIDETFMSLGESVKNTLYFKLENNFNISRNEIPKHIGKFCDFLYQTFGWGASHLEIRFMRGLHSKINVNIQVSEGELSLLKWIAEGMSFEVYVGVARADYCNP